MENRQQEKSNIRQKYEWAGAVTLACYIAMVSAVVSFLQDFRLEAEGRIWWFGKNWIHEIPEWVVVLLSCICWSSIFFGLGGYYKKMLNFKSILFSILGGIELASFAFFLLINDDSSVTFTMLLVLVVIIADTLMFIVGIQVSKIDRQQYIPTAFIVYPIADIVLLICSVFAEIEEISSEWITLGILIAELFALYLITLLTD